MADFDVDSLVSEDSEDLGQELMKFSLEDSVCHELSLDGDLSWFVLLHFELRVYLNNNTNSSNRGFGVLGFWGFG
ncbi:MAG: hypothetical protein AAB968_01365, partial [Patescibacteria group bacterium]